MGNVRLHQSKARRRRRGKARPPRHQLRCRCHARAGKYRMKFLVRENQSGKMGTFDARFVVPDLAADSAMLKTSSVIWSSQREPVKAVVGAAGKADKKAVASNPLIIAGEKVVPSITKVFHRNQNLYVSFRCLRRRALAGRSARAQDRDRWKPRTSRPRAPTPCPSNCRFPSRAFRPDAICASSTSPMKSDESSPSRGPR
jgi:hypothetical protein